MSTTSGCCGMKLRKSEYVTSIDFIHWLCSMNLHVTFIEKQQLKIFKITDI